LELLSSLLRNNSIKETGQSQDNCKFWTWKKFVSKEVDLVKKNETISPASIDG